MTKKMKPIKTLLKNGSIVDGTGKASFRGDILMEGGLIKEVSARPLKVKCAEVDCTGKMVAPGFIDMHSHNDWFLASPDKPENLTPFLEQGITTFVGGNCGFGAAGFKKNTPYRNLLENNLFKDGHKGLKWDSLSQYYDYISKKGMTHNLVTFAGHGTTRVSIKGYDPSPMNPNEMKEILGILEESMDQGARGVSFGMGYAPDIFTTPDEQKKVAQLVKRKNGMITVHVRAFSSVSGAYPLKPFGRAHNLIALEEFINLARETGVSLQISHLIFVGARTWKTLDRALALIDRARADGLDVRFDTYAHHCGATVITGILPEWFMARVPQAYDDTKLLRKVRTLMNISFRLLGFNAGDMQLASANHPELRQFDGMFMSDIARTRKMSDFDNYIDIAKRSGSTARILLHKYSNPKIIDALMRHEASHFMTDAWVETTGVQNPAAFGCFPRFIELARERRILKPEEVIHKMTGANAQRAQMRDRGILEKGRAADIVILDYERVRDTGTTERPEGRPEGIDRVFLNGIPVVEKGRALDGVRAGKVIAER